MSVLANCEPKKVFEYFEAICGVPHGSGNTKIVSDLLVGFAKELGLKYRQDELNNVVIFKDASAGYEGAQAVILQGHMDMVCAKTADCAKDMAKEGLDLALDGDWLHAIDTSLGGDDGIAVAMALAILADDSLKHPALEVLFTVDEEVGMDGAMGIDTSDLKGRRLLNIDSEEEGVFTVSCAGGLRADCFIPAVTEPVGDAVLVNIVIDGLLGGHSGCEIEKGRGNSNKLMSRFLYAASKKLHDLRLVCMQGGRFDNVICLKTEATVAVSPSEAEAFIELADEYNIIYKAEYASSDAGVSVKASIVNTCECCGCDMTTAYNTTSTANIVKTVFTLPQGVIEMSQDIKGLPQTSLNMGVFNTAEDGAHFSYSVRSSISSQKFMLLDHVTAMIETAGGTVSTRGMYPGWAYNRDSKFRAVLEQVYERQTGKKPIITATHGGLECGLFIEKMPGLDCVSIGPALKDIHSVGERLSVSSVERLYKLVVEFLAELTE